MQFLPDDSENKDHIRHKTPLDLARNSPYATPARWYRIHVDYIPTLLALCDYYIHADAHKGTGDEKQQAAAWWVDLQIILMTGIQVGTSEATEMDNAFCEQIAACIDSGNLDLTIQTSSDRANGATPADQITPTAAVASVELVQSCDPDQVYGAMVQMVDFMHQANLDILEVLIASVNFAQMAAAAIDAIPIVGTLTFDEMVTFVVVVMENFRQNYMASYNEGLRQQYICDLFCIVMKNCTLNLGEMGDYFAGRFTTELFTIDWQDLVELLLNGVWSGEEIVHVMHALAVYTFSAGIAFVGVNPNLFVAFVKSWFNDPDSDWQTLCEDCTEDTYIELNYAETHHNFLQLPASNGSWESGEGHTVYGHPDTSIDGVQIKRMFAEPYNISKASATLELRWGDQSTVSRPHAIKAHGVTESTEEENSINGNRGRVYHRTIDVFPTHLTTGIEIRGRAGSTGGNSYVKIRKLELWFPDGLPPEFD